LEDLPKLTKLLRSGARDISAHNVKIAGVFIAKSGKPEAFSMHIKNLPRWVNSFNIMTAEALAPFVAASLWPEKFNEAYTVVHCDNMSDCFAFVKGCSGHLETSAVVVSLHELLKREQVYFAWISTVRNVADYPTRLNKLEMLRKVLGEDIVFHDLDESRLDWDSIKPVFSKLRSMGLK
jgi:hypothetical protein